MALTESDPDVASTAPGAVSTWASKLAGRYLVTDFAVVAVVIFGTQLAWLGFDRTAFGFSGSQEDLAISYTAVSVVITVAWMIALRLFDTREPRVLGVGSREYRAVANASIRTFGLIAIVAFVFKIDLARGYILISFPLGLLLLIVSRWIWRKWLASVRRHGRYSARVLLLGSAESAATIARELSRAPEAGYSVVGACIPAGGVGKTLPGFDVPISHGVDRALEVMREIGADTIIVTSSDELAPERVRQLSWGLVPGEEHLVVAPGLMDIGGPRIHTRPVAGLPLIHVETPNLGLRGALTKRALDVLGSLALIVVLSPILLGVAVAVRLSSPGPVLFRQERVGIDGTPFTMLKFRSMVTDAESRLAELQQQRDAGNSVMFKLRDDPRVTPIGRVIRRFSLDELPQLFNVLGGSMSMVGPRPPLPSELDRYDAHVHRRFLVKPGLTGLWQISGRSNLSWEDTVRLDLYYVENWSLMGDLVILWRTARAVVGSDGAY